MIATNAGQAAVAVSSAHGVRERGGRSSRVVLSPRRWGQACETVRRRRGLSSPAPRGERAISRNTVAQGMPDCPALLW